MFAKFLKSVAIVAGLVPAVSLAMVVGAAFVQPAYADVASAKAAVDAAKTQGIVGEQGDGYVGFVAAAGDAALKAAVDEINAGRKAVYKDTAAKTGVTEEAAGEATAKLLLEKMPAGQYYKPLGGSWTKK